MPRKKPNTITENDLREISATIVEDDGTWVVRGRVYNPITGKTKQKSKSTGYKVKDKTKRKAEGMIPEVIKQWKKELLDEIRDYNRVASPDPTVKDYIEKWLAKKEKSVKGNTVNTYRNYARVNINPIIGDVLIKEVSPMILQDFVDEYLEDHTVTSLRKVLVVISGALTFAVREGVITTNYAEAKYLDIPRETKFEGQALDPEQTATLLRAVHEEGEPICAAVVLAVACGLRRSEVVGLRWQDVDLENKIIHVRNTVVEDGSLRIENETTKSEKGKRDIVIIESIMPYLRALKKEQETMIKSFNDGHVVQWRSNKKIRGDYLRKRLKRILEENELPAVRFHDLRHTTASLLSMAKVPVQNAQNYLGHEDTEMTMHYTHEFDEQKQETAEKLNGIMSDFFIDF